MTGDKPTSHLRDPGSTPVSVHVIVVVDKVAPVQVLLRALLGFPHNFPAAAQ
jgi:hypothetical protein